MTNIVVKFSVGKSKNLSKVDQYNRVVLPKEIRKRLRLQMGDQVIFIVEDGEVKLTSRAALVKKLSGAFALADGRNLTQELLNERCEEAERKRI